MKQWFDRDPHGGGSAFGASVGGSGGGAYPGLSLAMNSQRMTFSSISTPMFFVSRQISSLFLTAGRFFGDWVSIFVLAELAAS